MYLIQLEQSFATREKYIGLTYVIFIYYFYTGSRYQQEAVTLNSSPQCSYPFSDTNPKDIVDCRGEMSSTTKLNDGERWESLNLRVNMTLLYKN